MFLFQILEPCQRGADASNPSTTHWTWTLTSWWRERTHTSASDVGSPRQIEETSHQNKGSDTLNCLPLSAQKWTHVTAKSKVVMTLNPDLWNDENVNEFDATLDQHHSSNSEHVRERASTPTTNERHCINYMIRQRPRGNSASLVRNYMHEN